jgi:hypothetical protein
LLHAQQSPILLCVQQKSGESVGRLIKEMPRDRVLEEVVSDLSADR